MQAPAKCRIENYEQFLRVFYCKDRQRERVREIAAYHFIRNRFIFLYLLIRIVTYTSNTLKTQNNYYQSAIRIFDTLSFLDHFFFFCFIF